MGPNAEGRDPAPHRTSDAWRRTPWHHVTTDLIAAIRAQYRLHWNGIHGVGHWQRVHTNALRLAESTGADIVVVEYFAALHDACRFDDGHDAEHGLRAADLVRALDATLLPLDDTQRALLEEACRGHTTERSSDEPTIGTCWDADRLDLLRVGIMPSARYLSTEAARDPAVIAWATRRSVAR